jgi:PiT family inorganic phosphate transporter
MWQLASGVFFGWSLGTNDAANVFGTAVASRMVRFWTAAAICALALMLGAWLEGAAGMETYAALSSGRGSLQTAFWVCLVAAVTVTGMTWLRLPVSATQAVVGALLGVGAWTGGIRFGVLGKVVACWVGTPIGAMIVAVAVYLLLGQVINRLHLNMFQYDIGMRALLILAGAYGSYALGANNVANATAPFVGPGMLDIPTACLLGGASIALGVLTFSRGVMMTVGGGLVKLDAFAALVVVVAEGITVHIYAMLGVPVSTSQAVVGAVLGIGLVKGIRTVNRKTLRSILLAWVSTPTVAFALAWLAVFLQRSLG